MPVEAKSFLVPTIEPAETRIAVGRHRTSVRATQVEEMNNFKEEFQQRAQYKIEVHFGKKRSTSEPFAGALLIRETGRRFHGGGDEKMYWCGHTDCGKPIKTEFFAHMHVVCPHCKKESFLDPVTKKAHVDQLKSEGKDTRPILQVPCISGEKFFKLAPTRIADLLLKTFEDLDRDADIYLKFHPLDIRFDSKDMVNSDIDKLVKARDRRQPLIYPLKRIVQDLHAGADLHARFLAMITS